LRPLESPLPTYSGARSSLAPSRQPPFPSFWWHSASLRLRPTWRDASFALWLLSGLYLGFCGAGELPVLAAYVAGRCVPGFTLPEREQNFRDGCTASVVGPCSVVWRSPGHKEMRPATTATAPTGSASGASASVAGENMIAYELDRLFRSDRPATETDITLYVHEAARILLTASGHDVWPRMIAIIWSNLCPSRLGVSPAEAQSRVDDCDSPCQAIHRARPPCRGP